MAGEFSRNALLEMMKDSLASGEYSDLTITCGPDTYKAHRVIVCRRSTFFAKAAKFLVGKEAEDRNIDLPEDEPAIVKLLIQYLYEAKYEPVLLSMPCIPTTPTTHGSGGKGRKGGRETRISAETFPHKCLALDDYCSFSCPHHKCGYDCNYQCTNFRCDKCIPPVTGLAEQLVIHSKLYEIADKYDVAGLKKLAEEKFDRACQNFWDDPAFPIAAHHAFSTTPDHDKGLRDIVSRTIASHMELLNKAEIEVLMTEFNGLAFGLLKQKSQQNGWN